MLPSLPTLAKSHWTKAPIAAQAGRTFKRAQRGLFHGKIKGFGNNVPESEHRTRRTWLPNVTRASLYSAILDQKLKMQVTTSTLRTIDKVGGLDQYILQERFEPVLGEFGRDLKARLLQAKAIQAQAAQQALNAKNALPGRNETPGVQKIRQAEQ